MMKKVLFVAAVAMSLIFNGCIKEDSTYKKLQPVQPGVNIYQGAMNQNFVAMQQANIGMRLALLLGEAKKQGKVEVEDLDNLVVDKVNVMDRLLGISTKLTKTATGYKIEFFPGYTDIDYYTREGVVLIDTHGAEQLVDASTANPWSITFEDGLKMAYNGNTNGDNIILTGGSTEIYNEGDGTYAISIAGQKSYISNAEKLVSDWNGRFTLKPENANFAFSDCVGKKFMFNGSANGATFNTYDGASSTRMSFSMSNGEYYGTTSIRTGKVTAELLDNYNFSLYPSPRVTVEWTVNEAGTKVQQTISYNGNTVTI
ncbi:hypothetical protein [Alistipes sp.]|uniref:hypothetical protein n=1 Tax=Alistipes sp. TaxID=1872444 RepID=UPI003AB4FD36